MGEISFRKEPIESLERFPGYIGQPRDKGRTGPVEYPILGMFILEQVICIHSPTPNPSRWKSPPSLRYPEGTETDTDSKLPTFRGAVQPFLAVLPGRAPHDACLSGFVSAERLKSECLALGDLDTLYRLHPARDFIFPRSRISSPEPEQHAASGSETPPRAAVRSECDARGSL